MKKILLLLVAITLVFASFAMADDFGSVTGTGGYIYVSTGYQPRLIEVRTASPALAVWQYGMPATSCMKTVYTSASGAVNSYVGIATACLKVFTGNTASAPGFMIGIDSDLFPTGTVLRWHTIR